MYIARACSHQVNLLFYIGHYLEINAGAAVCVHRRQLYAAVTAGFRIYGIEAGVGQYKAPWNVMIQFTRRLCALAAEPLRCGSYA